MAPDTLSRGKHTPGPWEWDAGLVPPDGPGRYADIYVDGGETIIASFNDRIPEGRANARLIAAAPDLLKALKAATATCQTFLDDCGDVRDFTTQADINDWEEIISKAEGQ